MNDGLFTRWEERPLLRGAEAGLMLALLYALLFVIYAIIRSTIAIVAAAPRQVGQGLAADWASLLVSSIDIVIVIAVPAALFGMLGAFLVDRLLRAISPEVMRPGRALRGVGTGLAVMVLLHIALGTAFGFSIGLVPAGTYWFWLGAPAVIYVGFCGMLGWRRGVPIPASRTWAMKHVMR
jgi:hypothetical protein